MVLAEELFNTALLMKETRDHPRLQESCAGVSREADRMAEYLCDRMREFDRAQEHAEELGGEGHAEAMIT